MDPITTDRADRTSGFARAAFWTLWTIIALLTLAGAAGIIYVACHFIAKIW